MEGAVSAESPDSRERRQWRAEVIALLTRIAVLLEHPLREVVEEEIPGNEESLPTWILTDSQVRAVEEAVEAAQRGRGRAFGG